MTIVDPPSGWKYGFPKPWPFNGKVTEKEVDEWFLEQGYPKHLIDQGMLKHCRWWNDLE